MAVQCLIFRQALVADYPNCGSQYSYVQGTKEKLLVPIDGPGQNGSSPAWPVEPILVYHPSFTRNGSRNALPSRSGTKIADVTQGR